VRTPTIGQCTGPGRGGICEHDCHQAAEQAAATVNHGLAKAFLKLGLPPADRADKEN
jgi:hypothetical protein